MAQPDKDKQPDPPPRRNRAEAVARQAALASQTAFVRAGFADPTLVLHWDEIVGPEVARIARPLRLSESASGGVLTLKAEPGASLFLQHETRSLCDRINAYLGRPAVSRLRFVQGPLAGRPARAKSPITPPSAAANDPARLFHGSERLHAALLELARARGRPSGD